MTTQNLPIASGDTVQIHYTSKSLEGSIIETSVDREPFEFVVGAEEVIPGLSQGLVGRSAGETCSLAVPADQAFGKRNIDLVQSIPRIFLRPKVHAGDQLLADVQGVQLDVWVQKVQADEVVLDANHPLAGETLLIDVEIVSAKRPEASSN